MRKRTQLALTVIILLFATAAASLPWTIPIVSLRCAKFWAWHKLKDLTPEDRANLNATLVTITLAANPDIPTDAIKFETCLLTVPHPDSYLIRNHALILTYPRFKVIILPPHSLASQDAAARSLHYKSYFAFQSAVYNARLDDIDFQPDLHSLSNHLILLSAKSGGGLSKLFEQFDRADLRGFIKGSRSPDQKYVQVFSLTSNLGCGLIFEDQPGPTVDDVHLFISAFQINPAPIPSSSPTHTETLP